MRLMARTNRGSSQKFTVDITPDLIRQLGWKDGMTLQGTVAGTTLVLQPKVE